MINESYGPAAQTASRRRRTASRLPRLNYRRRRPPRWDHQQLADEIRFLEIAFERRRNPGGVDADVVVQELQRLRRQCDLVS